MELTGILSKFKGYLQTDGLEVYDDYDKSEHIIHLNCMAHARLALGLLYVHI